MANKYKLILISLCFIVLIVSSYLHHNNKTTHPPLRLTTIKRQSINKELNGVGILQSINIATIASPVDGKIEKILIPYGNRIKKDAPIFILSSEKLLDVYQAQLTEYIKSKTLALNSKTQMKYSKMLFKNNLISRDEFLARQNTWYEARLSLAKSTAILDNTLHKLNFTTKASHLIKLNDIQSATKALKLDKDKLFIDIKSPVGGIVAAAKSPDNSNIINRSIGDPIKQGDTLATIIDPNSLLVKILISEFYINQLNISMPATIEIDALPEISLTGKIISIDPSTNTTNNLTSLYPVNILIQLPQTLTKKKIFRGMRCKVSIKVKTAPTLTVPITAVKQSNNENWVTVINPKTKLAHAVKVKTGTTTQESVTILSGLKSGDTIVVTNTA